MKTTTMSFKQFFEMERGNITLKEIEQPNSYSKEFLIMIGLIILLGLTATTAIQTDSTQAITAFQFSNIVLP